MMAIKLSKTTPQFIAEAKKVHGNRYDYTRAKYSGYDKPTYIKCSVHGWFSQGARLHLNGHGCDKCGRQDMWSKRRWTKKKFVTSATSIHKAKYDYSRFKFIDYLTPSIILCPTHGPFSKTPSKHLGGWGCGKCLKDIKQRERQNKFIKEARQTHGKTYVYSRVSYKDCYTKVVITCRLHGDFAQVPRDHLSGCGCPKCKPTKYSRLAVKWIEEYAYSHRLKGVQHALNGGEYTLPGTQIRVDGYHPRSNTVFEFHGDAFHGNPKKHSPRSKPNPYSNKTAQRLYKETKARERLIRKLGYKLVVIWESDYHGYEWE